MTNQLPSRLFDDKCIMELLEYADILTGKAMGDAYERYLDSLSKTEPLPLNKGD